MVRWSPLLSLAVLAACGGKPTALRAEISFSRRGANAPDCVQVRAVDPASGQAGEAAVSLAARGLVGTLQVAIARDGWGPEVDVTATLHLGSCDSAAVSTDTRRATFGAGPFPSVLLSVAQPQAGADAGTDAGVSDGGADAGLDGGRGDAGADAGGGPVCDGGAREVRALGGWLHDLTMLDAGLIALGGADDQLWLGPTSRSGAFTSLAGGTCRGTVVAVWSRRSDAKLFVVSEDAGLLRVDGAAACVPLDSQPTALTTALAGAEDGGLTRLFAVGFTGGNNSPWGYVLDLPGGGGGTKTTLGNNGELLHDVDAVGTGFALAVGENAMANPKGLVYRWDPANGWQRSSFPNASTALYAVDALSPTHAYAGGQIFAELNGTTWAEKAAPPFLIYGLWAAGTDDVYAVGPALGGVTSLSHWNGTAWTPVASPRGDDLHRVRGTGACDVWAVGKDGGVISIGPH